MYANAADWAYRESAWIQRTGGTLPLEYVGGEVITLQDVRQLHYLTMNLRAGTSTASSNATPEEGPGNFRQHEIAALSSGPRHSDLAHGPSRA